MPLDRGAQRLLRMLASAGAAGPRTPEGRRRALQTLAELAEATPDGTVETRDFDIPGPGGPIGMRLYSPGGRTGAGASPVILYLHGGGWVAGGLDTHDGVCRRLTLGSGAAVLAADYRLAPEHPFPAAYEDALAAARWIAAEGAAQGLDTARLVVAGDSAGGGLAAAVAQSPQAPPIALQALICPILNLAEDSVSRREFADGYFLDAAALAADLADYAGPAPDLGDPRLSPGLVPRLAGPPALIHTAAYDPFRDEGEAYARRLAEAGIAVRQTRHAGMIHYFYALPRPIPYAAEALAAIGAEIAQTLA
ncbi:MAG: alpha/beta hydrolase [Caulobacteraceae bacterium]|nr:alpha/beta hydrolase [Caulobacteraceae bacterium]